MGAVMGVGMLMVMIVRVGMLMTVVVEMGMLMGMLVVMSMGMMMLMAVGNTIVGVLMGMGMGMFMVVGMAAHMIVMDVHSKFSFAVFLYYSHNRPPCQNIYFFPGTPMGACDMGKKAV